MVFVLLFFLRNVTDHDAIGHFIEIRMAGGGYGKV